VPSVSVVIPVFNAGGFLASCLDHLSRSTTSDYECIVVDDGSTDESVEIARRYGAKVITTGGRRGPAHARNLGARHAAGKILFFIDSDVVVYPNTLARLLSEFAADPGLDAVMGSYDDSPGAADFLSQYRNLMHCYMHQTGRREASTFWSGCGAIRSAVFREHGGFDESYGRPAIEDIELGYRLAAAGRKLILDRRLVVKHLKPWGLWKVVKTDVLDRGVPWTELILRDQKLPNDLNVQFSQRLSVALVFLMTGIAALTAVRWRGYFLIPLFAIVFFLLGRYWVDPARPRRSRAGLLSVAAAVGAIVWAAFQLDVAHLLYPVLLGYALLFLRERYACATYSRRALTGALLGAYMALSIVFILHYLPNHYLVIGFFSALAALIALNLKFYVFLAAKRGRLFAAAAVPFHLLYHFYSGIAFAAGLLRHFLRGRARSAARATGASHE
jgi:glycosyltransferase involved in cell wall biosynthesis